MNEKVQSVKKAVVKVASIVNTRPDGTADAFLGSGFFVSEQGHILTNDHVIANADVSSNFVCLQDGTTRRIAKILERNRQYDFAIIQAEGTGYQRLQLGSYDGVDEGEEVYFCGYPLGSKFHTTHKGIVSAKFRENSVNIVQLDASVNKGNSGGPLLSLRNDLVVGIITKKMGGVDEALKEIAGFVGRAPTVFTLDWTLPDGRKVSFDPTKALVQVIDILERYTNIGIGLAYSIDYAKEALAKQNIPL